MPGFRVADRTTHDVEILVRGTVNTQDVMYVQDTITELTRSVPGVQHVRAKLAEYRGSDHRSICVAQVNIDCAGRLVRGQESAATVIEAVDRMTASLLSRVRRLDRHLCGVPVGPPSFTGEQWNRRSAREIRPVVKLGGRARGLVRHKAYPLAMQDADAAAFMMELRDYDFHVFLDDASGQDAVLHRAGPTGYRLAGSNPATLMAGMSSCIPVGVDAVPLPPLTLPEAVRALDAGGAPFLAFAGVGIGRSAVLYRRFDGHLGLVRPL